MGVRIVASVLCGVAALSAPVRAQTAPPRPVIVARPETHPAATPTIAAPDALQDEMSPLPGAVDWPAAVATTAGDADIAKDPGDVRYEVQPQGLAEMGLAARFRELSALWAGRNQPANLAQINRRATEDRDLIDQLLRAEGYYGATVTVTIVPPGGTGQPTRVAIKVEPGALYTFASIDLDVPADAPKPLIEKALGIAAGQTVDATAVGAAEDGLRLRLADAGYPFPNIVAQDIVIDHASRTATLSQRIDPGRRASFGRVRFADGVVKAPFDDAHLARLARLKRGDRYNGADLEDLRRALIQTGLVGAASIRPVAQDVAPDGSQFVDLVVTTETAPLRTIAAQIGYSTDQGIRFEGSWQHRNLLPPEGAVTFRAVAAEREQLLGAEFRRRNWKKRDVTLLLRAEFSAAAQDAFTARTLTLGGAIARETNIIWQKKWTYSLGTEVVVSSEKDRSNPTGGFDTYYIAAVPLALTYDGSDNLLDPTRGFRLTGRASPELSYQAKAFSYLKAQIDGTGYLPFGRVVLAGRLHVGTILGASRGTIAPTRRFYAGGGGSVRGFSYQAVGPRDADNNPLGGNSLVEASVEARFRFKAFGSDVGIVPFVDAGGVDTGTLPGVSNLKVGAGLGFRYYTPFGPIRIDVATPLNPGRGDPRVAFYVSIGQAF